LPFVWRARDEWLPLFSARRTKAEHLLLACICFFVLGLFLTEYLWLARKVRVALFSWPVWFSMKGLPPAAVVGLLVAFRPFVEELFFRGFVQTRFERVMTARHALIAQAMLFSAAHGVDGAVVNDLLVGLTLGWLRSRARNIYAPLRAARDLRGLGDARRARLSRRTVALELYYY
jgi:membrane protease YdiL (CAAX protease family)